MSRGEFKDTVENSPRNQTRPQMNEWERGEKARITGWWAESRKTLTVGDLDFRHGLCDGTVLPGGLRGPGG